MYNKLAITTITVVWKGHDVAWDWGDSQVLGALNGGGAKNVEEGWGKTSRFLRELKQQTKNIIKRRRGF